MSGVNTNNDIKLKQNQQDSPFLTLSERNKKGINNVFGDNNVQETQDPKRTERVAQMNIFGAEDLGQANGNEPIIGQQEEKSCDAYFQENAQGEMNFDTNGFYDDALGLNFGNSGATNPISGGATKTGGSSDTKNLETELKLMLRDPENNKEQIGQLKEQIEAAGGNADDIIADGLKKAESAHGGAKDAEKTGSSTGDGGASEINSALSSIGAGSTSGTTSSSSSGVNADRALSSNGSVSDLMAYTNSNGIGAQVDIVAGRGKSTSSSSSSSGSSGSSGTSEQGFGEQMWNSAKSAVTNAPGTLVSSAVSKVGDGILSFAGKATGISDMMDQTATACGNKIKQGMNDTFGTNFSTSDAKNAKDVKTAEGNVKNGETGAADANKKAGENKAASTDATNNARSEDVKAEQAEQEKATQETSAETQKEIENAKLDEEGIKKAEEADQTKIKEAKHAEGEQLTQDISATESNISALESEISRLSSSSNESDKAQVAAKKGELAQEKAKLAEQKAKLARCREEESVATTNAEEAKKLAEEANTAAKEAESAAKEAQQLAKTAAQEAGQSKAASDNFDLQAANTQKAAQDAQATEHKAQAYKQVSQDRLNELKSQEGAKNASGSSGSGSGASAADQGSAPAAQGSAPAATKGQPAAKGQQPTGSETPAQQAQGDRVTFAQTQGWDKLGGSDSGSSFQPSDALPKKKAD